MYYRYPVQHFRFHPMFSGVKLFWFGRFPVCAPPPPQADSMTTRTALKLQIPAPPLGEMLMMMLDHLT